VARHGGNNDLDVVAGFSRVPGRLKLAELEQWSSDPLGMTVDLIVRETLTGRIGERILSETVPV
jgi:predicted nucleotidyltransferase